MTMTVTGQLKYHQPFQGTAMAMGVPNICRLWLLDYATSVCGTRRRSAQGNWQEPKRATYGTTHNVREESINKNIAKKQGVREGEGGTVPHQVQAEFEAAGPSQMPSSSRGAVTHLLYQCMECSCSTL